MSITEQPPERDEYLSCSLCPRECRVNRHSMRGRCGMGADMQAARAMIHLWEEPCIAGAGGAGAVFFSGCGLKCRYCQNYPISHEGRGVPMTVERLAEVMRRLTAEGASCIDLVTGTHFTPSIVQALSLYQPPVPVVWNSSGYEKVSTLRLLKGRVQVYLPDLKHYSPRIAGAVADCPGYFEAARDALLEMRRQVGENVYAPDGQLIRGMLVRHLLLPGATGDCIRLLEFLAQELPGVPVSLMRQYTPMPFCTVKGLDRRVTNAEYERVLQAVADLNITGYFQEGGSADSAYTPVFDGQGIVEDG